jgi:hydrogenase nickel insertion protein HypA
MHERSLVRALLRQVEQLAAEHPKSKVLSVRVRMGEFSGVEPDLLASAYGDMVQETPLRGAVLNMERVPLEASCNDCGSVSRIERYRFQCAECGSVRVSIRGGEEMLLDSVTFEEPEL